MIANTSDNAVKMPPITEEQKKIGIARIKEGFKNLRSVLDDLEEDIEDADLDKQTSAVYIASNILHIYTEFMTHIRNMSKNVKQVQDEIEAAAKSQEASEHE